MTDEGYIEHDCAGERTVFHRLGYVYVLKVKVPAFGSWLSWQSC